MSTKIRIMLIAAVAAVFGLAFGGSALALDLPGLGSESGGGGIEAPALGELGDASHGECAEELLGIPALDACEDEEGRVIMDLPGLKLVGPKALPETGADVGDFAAMGAVALAGGAALLRRVRLSVA